MRRTGHLASRIGLFAAGLFFSGVVVGSGACASTTREYDPGDEGGGGTGGTGGTGGSGGAGGMTCPSNLATCSGVCVNKLQDPMHCGTCDNACGPAQICSNGACGCGPTATLCGGACVDTTADPANCGTCDFLCPDGGPNTTPACEKGLCGFACAQGFSDCDNAAPGCETSTSADPQNCGACGLACQSPGNTTVTCANSMCVAGGCLPGFDDCDGDPANGCEANLVTSSEHCGACGLQCVAGMTCTNGACGLVDLSGVFSTYSSEGRNVHLWKSPTCAPLAGFANFCQARGLKWWSPKSAPDAQLLIDHAYNLDMNHTWIQVYGVATGAGSVGGFPVAVNDGSCLDFSSPSDFGAFRKWGCSFCDPEVSSNANGQSCCWDKDHVYDWFVCET